MNLKEQLIKLKKILCNRNDEIPLLKRIEEAKKEMNNNDDCLLDERIKRFLNWYSLIIEELNRKSTCNYHSVENIVNFIDKMAIWYELRYPDNSLEKIFSSQINKEENSWSNVLNRESFFGLLNKEEKDYLRTPIFPSTVTLNNNSNIILHLTKNGKVKETVFEDDDIFEKKYITDILRSAPLENVPRILYIYGLLPFDNDEKIDDVLLQYHSQFDIREKVLDCVMYKIIEHGKGPMGEKRAFLFAKEFSRNIDIPMAYGYSCFDPDFRVFVNEYLKAGGKKDLLCYVFNDSLTNKVPLEQLLQNNISSITEEEKQLYQRLVNALITKKDFSNNESNIKIKQKLHR